MRVPWRSFRDIRREDQILPHLAALAILHVGHGQAHGGTMQVTAPAETAGLIDRAANSSEHVTLTYDPDTRTIRSSAQPLRSLRAGTADTAGNSSLEKEAERLVKHPYQPKAGPG